MLSFLWPLCLMSVGIKLSQEYCLCFCRETQPFTDATRLWFFHLETESKEIHKIIKANQFPLPHRGNALVFGVNVDYTTPEHVCGKTQI